MGTTQQLARFIAEYDTDAMPIDVREQAVRCLVNWAACAVGGSRHPAVNHALAALRPFIGKPQATLLGRSERVDALHAALLNGISSHVLDFDDTHLDTLVHPSGPVISALLALAQYQRMDGKTFVDAVACGIEVECRIALGIYPSHYNIGWHITGTVGGFGAAAAVGRALRLNQEQAAWALGIAATQAGGLREMFGTMCKSLHPGRAAHSGLSAALMAASGFNSSYAAIEAPRGFAHVLSPECDLDRMTHRLGETWEIRSNSFKPYACGVVIHPVIDGCIALHQRDDFDVESVAQVTLQVHPLVMELTGKTEPETGLEGKFSVNHSAAKTLIDGFSSTGHYTDAAVQDPATIALRHRVAIQIRHDIREDEAKITVELKDGRTIHHHVDHALGSKERPMSGNDLSAKFHTLVTGILSPMQARDALDICWNAASLPDAAQIAERMATRVEASLGADDSEA